VSLREAAAATVHPPGDGHTLNTMCGPVRVDANVLGFSERCPLPGDALDLFDLRAGAFGKLVLSIPEYVVARELAVWLHGLEPLRMEPERAQAIASAMVGKLVADAEERVSPSRVAEILTEAETLRASCTDGDAGACHELGLFDEFLRGVGANNIWGVAARQTACRLSIEIRIRERYGGSRAAAEGALARCRADPSQCAGGVALMEKIISDSREFERRALEDLRASEEDAGCPVRDPGRTLISEECSWMCAE
jgi:hypothetical protein